MLVEFNIIYTYDFCSVFLKLTNIGFDFFKKAATMELGLHLQFL
jgi:hypothetical protein